LLVYPAMIRRRRLAPRCAFSGPLAASLLLAAPAVAELSTSYAWVRTLDGAASFAPPSGDGDREVVLNAPLATGDRLWSERRSRLEIALPDGALVRLDGESGLELSALANSGDRAADGTILRLEVGRLQLAVPDDLSARAWPRLDTANATVHVESGGRYRLATDGAGWTEIVVREGSAEVVTQRGSARLRAGEAVQVDGDDWPRLALIDADPEDALERWGLELDEEIRRADLGGADSELRVAAGRLARHGSWVSVGGRSAWRPRGVAVDWRPFVDGRWVYLPSGYTWVTPEPWGWATSHYGGWDHVPGWGWVWFPGRIYSPAWVYWYWGPSHVGWCPTAYYTRAYSHWGSYRAFRHGVYGWAGGWNGFADWTFCPYGSFRRRSLREHCRRGEELRAEVAALPRGIITTDTRPVAPSAFERGGGVPDGTGAIDRLRRAAVDTRPGSLLAAPRAVPALPATGDLPDVSAFVGRRRDLADDLVRAVAVDSLADGPSLLQSRPPQRPTPRERDGRVATAVRPSPGSPRPAAGASLAPASPTAPAPADADSARAAVRRPVPGYAPVAPAPPRPLPAREPARALPAPSGPSSAPAATPAPAPRAAQPERRAVPLAPAAATAAPTAPVRRVVDSVRRPVSPPPATAPAPSPSPGGRTASVRPQAAPPSAAPTSRTAEPARARSGESSQARAREPKTNSGSTEKPPSASRSARSGRTGGPPR
jgi:hypothetical protein